MCDYSLHSLPNRLAEEGEDLVVHRFPLSTLGLASPAELQVTAEPETEEKSAGFWSKLKSWFIVDIGPSVPAVCIPPGARLFLQDIPRQLQSEIGVTECEEVTFTQLSALPNTYRDAIRFENGREVLLQKLKPGQRVKVLCLSLPDEVAEPKGIRFSPTRPAW